MRTSTSTGKAKSRRLRHRRERLAGIDSAHERRDRLVRLVLNFALEYERRLLDEKKGSQLSREFMYEKEHELEQLKGGAGFVQMLRAECTSRFMKHVDGRATRLVADYALIRKLGLREIRR